MEERAKPKVVIVGAGFAGLEAAKRLGKARADVTIVDRSNHHLFQPLLYQVATAGLAPSDIAVPIRSILRRQKNVRSLMGEVVGVDTQRQLVELKDLDPLPYDYLILATGARHSYFGQSQWEEHAPGLKTIEEAVCIRRNILYAFECAERELDPEKQLEYLTFVIVGGGPTGVELAGAIAELAGQVLVRDFRRINSGLAQVILVEAGSRVLSGFPEPLSRRALVDLARLGVEVRLETPVTAVDNFGVDTTHGRISARTVLWAAGVEASLAARWLGVEADRAGRVPVKDDLSVEGLANVFVLGDVARFDVDGEPLPGLAPVAMQQGRHAARVIRSRLQGSPSPGKFRYRDKGSLATIGRGKAVAVFRGFQFGGGLAWLVWLFVHILYLIDFRNKIIVLLRWTWAYVTWQGGARLITNCPD
jgi:NADH:ubiquinone reductase (H+-translocating)